MNTDSKLMDMLTGYASAHQHPFNVAVHMIGIPTIMLGAFIALSWANVEIAGIGLNGAHLATLVLFAFYFTLDKLFSLVFLLYAVPVAWIATVIGAQPMAISGTVAAADFLRRLRRPVRRARRGKVDTSGAQTPHPGKPGRTFFHGRRNLQNHGSP